MPDETLALQEYAFDSLRFADFVVLSVQAADRVQVRKNPEVGVSIGSSVRRKQDGRRIAHACTVSGSALTLVRHEDCFLVPAPPARKVTSGHAANGPAVTAVDRIEPESSDEMGQMTASTGFPQAMGWSALAWASPSARCNTCGNKRGGNC
jgi:hypothetical protein